MHVTCASQLDWLEALTFEELGQVEVADIDAAAAGLASYAANHFRYLLPIGSEQPGEVTEQIESGTGLRIPSIYATVLASGSNWWRTPKYKDFYGHVITTAEMDMMIMKAHFFYRKDMAVRKRDLRGKRDDIIKKMLRAEDLHKEMHQTLAVGEIPDCCRDVERWPGYLEYLGNFLPRTEAWDAEWLCAQRDRHYAAIQVRKAGSGCIFYRILCRALGRYPGLVCVGTCMDNIYGVGMLSADALRSVRSRDLTAEQIGHRGGNMLGRAHHSASMAGWIFTSVGTCSQCHGLLELWINSTRPGLGPLCWYCWR